MQHPPGSADRPEIPATWSVRGHRAGIPRGAGSGRAPFPAQSPVRLEGRFSSEQPGSV